MKKTDYECIAISDPINKTAKRVVQSGEHFDFNQENMISSTDPIPVKDFPGQKDHDLTGEKFGRLKVIGYYGKGSGTRTGKWVVKCLCGNYELRRAAALKKTTGNDCGSMCYSCDQKEGYRRNRKNQPDNGD